MRQNIIIKMVLNRGIGGFSLSREAILLARQMSGNPKWGGECLEGDLYEDGTVVDFDYGRVDVPRHDPFLVKTVEILKEESCGDYATLEVLEVEFTYYLQDHDTGYESVIVADVNSY